MRQAIIAGRFEDQHKMVLGAATTVEKAKLLLLDRYANGESFPQEVVIRLPRRVRVDQFNRFRAPFIRS
jgi:hypothetical protein